MIKSLEIRRIPGKEKISLAALGVLRRIVIPVFIICVMCVSANVRADDAQQTITNDIDINSLDDAQASLVLRHDIELLDAELTKCEKKRKGWVAATILGGVGVVSTGVAAAVQAKQLGDKRKELKDGNGQDKTAGGAK